MDLEELKRKIFRVIYTKSLSSIVFDDYQMLETKILPLDYFDKNRKFICIKNKQKILLKYF